MAHHLGEVLALRLDGAFLPDLGHSEWSRNASFTIAQNRFSPDITRVILAGDALVELAPVQGTLTSGRGVWDLDALVLAGPGLAWTVDDLDAIQCDGPPGEPCLQSASQVPLTMTVGGGVRLHRERAMLRLELRRSWFSDTVDGTEVSVQGRTWFGLRVGALIGA